MILAFTGMCLSAKQRHILRRDIEAELATTKRSLDASVIIDVKQELRKNQYSSLWYGGDVADIHYKGWTFELSACGDVYASLCRKSDNTELVRVKDKNNDGRLGEELRPYIRTDNDLYDAINGEHGKYTIELLDNNWYECFVIDSVGRFYDLMWALDSDHALGAIAEIIGCMDGVIAEAAKETG